LEEKHMSIIWHDVSIPLRAGVTVWPGDPDFERAPSGRIAEGDSSNTSVLSMPSHTGTHCDAPWHFEDDGKRLDEVDTSLYFGDALLREFPDVDLIRAEDLGDGPFAPRMLFKTRNSGLAAHGPFHEDYVALDEDAAKLLVEKGVRLVGIDYLSIAPFGDTRPTHHVLLQNEVFIVEGLRLAAFSEGTYPFVVLPLPLEGADGAPCRAFLGVP